MSVMLWNLNVISPLIFSQHLFFIPGAKSTNNLKRLRSLVWEHYKNVILGFSIIDDLYCFFIYISAIHIEDNQLVISDMKNISRLVRR